MYYFHIGTKCFMNDSRRKLHIIQPNTDTDNVYCLSTAACKCQYNNKQKKTTTTLPYNLTACSTMSCT